MKRIAFILFFAAKAAVAQNGPALTLEQCIDIAINKNLQVEQAKIQQQTDAVYWNSSRMNLLPNLFGNVSNGINSGRNIDPSTNTYVSQQITFSGYELSSGLTLFNGLALQQTVVQNRLLYEAATLDWQQQKNNITLNIILAYLQVLSNEDLLTQSMQQSALSFNQVRRLETLNREGAIAPYQFTDLQGQYANDQLSIITARNQLQTSRIDLFRLMNVPYQDSVRIKRIDTAQVMTLDNRTAPATYAQALQSFAQIRANDFRVESARHGVKAARGAMFPLLSFSGDLRTTYSSGTETAYKTQLDNNLFSSLSVNLSIPLFNRSYYRNNVRLAKLVLAGNEAVAGASRTSLQQDVYQAHANMDAAQAKLLAVQQQSRAYDASFRSAEIRFNEGVINSVDYLIAKNNLDRANINLIAARYDYVLRKKILDFYSGTLHPSEK